MTWPTAQLSEVCEQERRSIRAGQRLDLPYIGMESIEAHTGWLTQGDLSKTPEAPEANSFHFDSSHVLYGKLRPYLNKVYVPESEGKCSTELIPLKPTDRLDRRFLAYFLRAATSVESISRKVAGARMPRADMDFVLSMHIPLPPLVEQRRIIDLLSRAENIVRMQREAEANAKEIIPALFIDMFGDPATNPKGWGSRLIGDAADIQGGLQVTTKRANLPIEIPYLRVANVHRTHLDLSEIKLIRATETELNRTRLLPGDLLVIEGHGNPAEIGRVGIWPGGIDPCVHQNHLIRVRCRPASFDPTYVWAYLNSADGRRFLLREGKTTSGLNTISVSNVKRVNVPAPPIELQRKFAERIAGITELQASQFAATLLTQQALQSLLASVFGGKSVVAA